jgi:hypothetical protein
MTDRRPTERLITADDLPDRDMWYDPEELDPYMDEAEDKIAELTKLVERAEQMFCHIEEQLGDEDWMPIDGWRRDYAALRESGTEGNLPAEEDT